MYLHFICEQVHSKTSFFRFFHMRKSYYLSIFHAKTNVQLKHTWLPDSWIFGIFGCWFCIRIHLVINFIPNTIWIAGFFLPPPCLLFGAAIFRVIYCHRITNIIYLLVSCRSNSTHTYTRARSCTHIQKPIGISGIRLI